MNSSKSRFSKDAEHVTAYAYVGKSKKGKKARKN